MAWLYKQTASENWWIGYRVNGKQYRRSTGTPDRKQAERELAKIGQIDQAQKAGTLTEEFFRLITNQQAPTEPLRGYADQWLDECRDLSGKTLERYRDVMREFCQSVNATPETPLLRDVRPEAIGSFLRAKRAKTSTATAKLCRRILATFFNYAVENRVLSVSPVPSAKSLMLTKDSKSARRAFTLTELKTLYTKAPNDFWRYMVLAGFYMGQRMGDLITLTWAAVDFEHRVIRLTTRKTGTAMQIPLRAELETALRELKKRAGAVNPADAIWPEQAKAYAARGAGEFSNQFYEDVLLPAGLVPARPHQPPKEAKAIGRGGRRKVNAVSFHCLRHTFVSLLKVTGGSQAVAKELAGHSSDAVSDLYTHVPEEALSKAINQLPQVTN